ncbi:ETX/MTX2 family pore-forming toxin [Streptomyces sp. NPDC059015]|uniref:ETX/MTX2 family pore-forming toxin n=1 Tax=unclassified Streptomyces TaxID=2593676 RepID=UPI0036A1AA11
MVLVAATPSTAATTITDLNSMLLTQFKSTSSGVVAVEAEPTQSETKVTAVGTPSVLDVAPAAVATTTLNNLADFQVNQTTQPQSKAITTSTTTTVTTGFSSATKVSATFKLSDLVSVGADTTTTVSYSNATAQTSSTTDTYTLPAQTIPVPARSRMCVYGELLLKKATGNIALNTKLGGYATVIQSPIGFLKTSIYNGLVTAQSKGAPALPAGFSLNSSTKTLDFKGAATYSSVYGTDLQVTTYQSPSLTTPCPAKAPTVSSTNASAGSFSAGAVRQYTVPLAGNVN